jgi:hypothetical protein
MQRVSRSARQHASGALIVFQALPAASNKLPRRASRYAMASKQKPRARPSPLVTRRDPHGAAGTAARAEERRGIACSRLACWLAGCVEGELHTARERRGTYGGPVWLWRSGGR